MGADEAERRRILVALDTGTLCLASLETAVELAARLDADLDGLFVEDLNLLRSAALPVVRQVSLLTACSESFDPAETERELRAMAARAEGHLAAHATRREVRWTFRIVRARVAEAVIAAAEASDLLVVQGTTWPLSRRVHMDASARTAVTSVRKSLVILPPGGRLGRGGAIVLYDDPAEGERLLDTAARLCPDDAAPLDVILLGAEARETVGLEGHVDRWRRERDCVVRVRHLPGATWAKLCRLLTPYHGTLLVLSGGLRLLADQRPECLLEAFDGPIFLLR